MRGISTAGGLSPRWRGDGRELFYVSGDNELVAVSVSPGESFEGGAVETLFREDELISYDVTGDGRRFILNVGTEGTASTTTVVFDWDKTEQAAPRPSGF